MQKLPDHLSTEIFANLFHQYSLFSCEIDQQGRIVQMWGDNRYYGLEHWGLGRNLREEDFLLGLPFDEEWIMRDVNVSPIIHADIYFTPNIRGKRYLVFVSTEGSIKRRRENQQRGNELTLLTERNKKLILELENAKESLKAENAIKSKFIAGMSHEFRTPLTSIMGYTHLIGEITGLNTEVHNHLAAIERSSRHLLSMVENLLDQSQFESDEFQLQLSNVSLEDLLVEISAIIAPLAAEKGLGFSADMTSRCSRYAYMDNMRVRQILINLLGNAVKFTDDGKVSVLLDQENGNFVLIVTDSGPGISLEDQEKIFTAYNRLQQNSSTPGVGLGLSITQQLVTSMQGSIKINSMPGEGTSFIVTLPHVEAEESFVIQQTQPVPIEGLNQEHSGKTILLVEDNPDISNLLKILLTRSGYEVAVEENGQLALAQTRSKDFDMVITDLQMPVLDGKELVRFLRKDGFLNPVIALTASHKLNERQELYDIGFSAFLTKPVQMPELLSTLDRLSSKSGVYPQLKIDSDSESPIS